MKSKECQRHKNSAYHEDCADCRNELCEHDWQFDYQEFYDGSRPGYLLDRFHCRKCLRRESVKVDGQWHHKR